MAKVIVPRINETRDDVITVASRLAMNGIRPRRLHRPVSRLRKIEIPNSPATSAMACGIPIARILTPTFPNKDFEWYRNTLIGAIPSMATNLYNSMMTIPAGRNDVAQAFRKLNTYSNPESRFVDFLFIIAYNSEFEMDIDPEEGKLMLVSDDGSFGVVNNRIVGLGSPIDGAKVESGMREVLVETRSTLVKDEFYLRMCMDEEGREKDEDLVLLLALKSAYSWDTEIMIDVLVNYPHWDEDRVERLLHSLLVSKHRITDLRRTFGPRMLNEGEFKKLFTSCRNGESVNLSKKINNLPFIRAARLNNGGKKRA